MKPAAAFARGNFLRATMVAALGLTLVACGSGSAKTPASSATSATALVSATQLNNDSALVDTALTAYTSRDASTLTTTDQLTAFVATTSTDLTQLRSSFDVWSKDLDHVDQSEVAASSKQAYPLMLAYRDALNAWITEQTDENSLAATCLQQSTPLLVQACYTGAISKYTSTAVDAKVKSARQQLTTALGG